MPRQRCLCYKNYRQMKAHLPCVVERLKDLVDREPFVSGILLEGIFDLLRLTVDVEEFLDKDFVNGDSNQIEKLEKKIVECADCPAEYHYKKKRPKEKRSSRRASVS